MDAVAEALRAAEDGLDPHDALTAEEALARVVWLLRTEQPVEVGYTDLVGISELTEWAHTEKGSHACAAFRKHLEQRGLIAAWA